MIPISSKCLKQQQDSRPKIIKQHDMRLTPMGLHDYCSHMHNPIQIMESYIKNQFDLHQSHNFMGIQPDQCFYDHNFQIKSNWYINNNNWNEDFYNYKIKREQYDQQKMWPSQIKDQESPLGIHEQGFQACQILKHQEIQYPIRCSFEDPNKFVGPLITTKQQKNSRRKLKVLAYLRKKKMRSYQKKIIYKCRKQVADNRIRYRGRFISLIQAIQILKLDPKQSYTPAQLIQKLKIHNPIDFLKQEQQKKGQKHQEPQLNQQIQTFSVKKIQEDL